MMVCDALESEGKKVVIRHNHVYLSENNNKTMVSDSIMYRDEKMILFVINESKL